MKQIPESVVQLSALLDVNCIMSSNDLRLADEQFGMAGKISQKIMNTVDMETAVL